MWGVWGVCLVCDDWGNMAVWGFWGDRPPASQQAGKCSILPYHMWYAVSGIASVSSDGKRKLKTRTRYVTTTYVELYDNDTLP